MASTHPLAQIPLPPRSPVVGNRLSIDNNPPRKPTKRAAQA